MQTSSKPPFEMSSSEFSRKLKKFNKSFTVQMYVKIPATLVCEVNF